MLAQREEQQSEEFKDEYKRRAGVEGTLSQGVRVGGMRVEAEQVHWKSKDGPAAHTSTY